MECLNSTVRTEQSQFRIKSLSEVLLSECVSDLCFSPYLQDSRSEHERQYLFSQGHGLAENTELIKSPR